jgi:hypothetical protein
LFAEKKKNLTEFPLFFFAHCTIYQWFRRSLGEGYYRGSVHGPEAGAVLKVGYHREEREALGIHLPLPLPHGRKSAKRWDKGRQGE